MRAWFERRWQDLRYALRGLRRSPAFAITVILTLGLGIGANTAMFGIIDRLMFKPFPYLRDQASVHRVYVAATYRGSRFTGGVSEYTTYLDLKKWTHSFSQAAGVTTRTLAIGSGSDSRERPVGLVSAAFWDFFDAPPALGRYFHADEDSVPRGADVSVLSYAAWKGEFGGRNVVGEQLQVANVMTTIIGVAPPGFLGIWDDNPPDVYIPITTYAGATAGMSDKGNYYTRYNWGWMDMMVRRKPGVTSEAANADLAQAEVKSWDTHVQQEPRVTPTKLADPTALVGPLKTAAGPDPSIEARTVRWVGGIALIVLLIACSNVANLFLARALRRRRETAVRIALGGGRARLMAQWFTESLVLALLGCVAGVLIAQWGGVALRRLFVGTGAAIPVATDFRTLLVSVGLAILAAVATGLAPLLATDRSGVSADLKAGAREGTHRRSRLRTGLLVAQVAMSAVLLAGAGLFVRSFAHVRELRLGFDFDRAVLVSRNLRGVQLPDSALITLQQRMLAAAQAIPGVEHAALVSSVPFWSTSSISLYVAGIDSVQKLGRFTYQSGSPDYFATMGTRIIRGRGFTDADRDGSTRIVVVSQAMAGALWPGRDAIGECIRIGADTMPCTTVVGIAEDAAQNDLSPTDKRYRYYVPLDQYGKARGFFVVTRVHGSPALASESVRKAIQAVMPGDSYVTTQPLADIVSSRQRSWRFGATMFVAFGFLALVVAGIGLYGVIGYDVAQRMHELGVRVALGAQQRDLLRLVMAQGARVAAVGIAVGAVTIYAAGGAIQPLLFNQRARDPLVFGAVATILLVVAVVATLAPAMRAARADPNTALRSD